MIIKSLSAVESELLGEYTYSHSSYWRGGSFLEAQSSEELAFYVPSYNLWQTLVNNSAAKRGRKTGFSEDTYIIIPQATKYGTHT